MIEIELQFLAEIDSLKKLLNFFTVETKLNTKFAYIPYYTNDYTLKDLAENYQNVSVVKRQFNYNSVVISLYGYFEKFIENLLMTYIDTINSYFEEYHKLPESIIKNHFILSISLLNKVEQTRYSGVLKKEEIIKNLHTCLNVNEQFQLNKDAFAQHTANFRSQVIDASFNHVGIESISSLIMKEELFYKFTIEKSEKNLGDLISPEESFYHLNDLAERRNDVAHGVPSEILNNEILHEYLDFFDVYASAITKVLSSSLLNYELGHNCVELGDLTDVFNNGKIICIYTLKNKIRNGDIIIGKNSEKIVKANISEIMLHDKVVDFVDQDNNYEVGLKIDQPFKKNFKVISH